MILLAGFLMVCAIYCLTPVHNGNIFWHLRNGEDIIETGEIRTSDPFTWTCRGNTWLQQEWLSEVSFAASWLTAGEAGPVLFKTLTILFSVLFVYLAARKRGASVQAVVLTGLLWFILSHGRWIVRPHILSLFFFSLYLYLLAKGTGGVLKSLAIFIPLQILWTNAHAGFIMGYFLLGIPVLENLIAKDWKTVIRKGVVLGAAILSCGVHPNGFNSFTYITDFLSRPLFRETIREWWSPFHPLYQPGHWISTTAILLVLILAATWTLVIVRRKNIGIAHIAALGALSIATVLSSRNIDMLSLAAIAWTAPLLKRVPFSLSAVMLAAAAAVPFITGVPMEFGPPREIGLGVDWSIYPRQLVEFLEENDELLEARVFNTNEISGYLEYTLGERLPLYMDGRCHLYPEKLYAEYLILAYSRMQDTHMIMNIFDSYGINMAIYDWPKNSESSAYILSASPKWCPVYWDDITIVYGRKSYLESIGFQWHSFPHIDPLSPDIFLETPSYLVPESWKNELLLASSPPLNFTPSIITTTALLLSDGSMTNIDTLPFMFRNDSLETALTSALQGDAPCIDDPRLRELQALANARNGRFDEAIEAAEYSGDEMLLGCLVLLAGEHPSENSIPPLMVHPIIWDKYLTGDMSGADSSIVEASAMFVCGMRDRSMGSVMAVMNGSEVHSPWTFSVSGYLAALSGMDSLAVLWGDSSLSLNRNLYTILIRGNIAGITGNLDQAIEFYSECINTAEAFHEARYQRARYLWMNGSIEAAMEDYRFLRQLNYLSPAVESMLEWGEYLSEGISRVEEHQ